MTTRAVCSALAILWPWVAPAQTSAQPLGAFRWQLQPYCNTLVVTVTPQGGSYTLDGYDDLCGAAQRAPLVGLATPNPDGSIGFGLTITSATAVAVQVDARIALTTFSGVWRDSQGQSGTFAFNGAAAGSPRPLQAPVSPGTSTTFLAPQTFAAGLSAGGVRVTSVGTPTASDDAATKAYVDAAVAPAGQFTFRNDGGFVARGQGNVGTIPATGPGARTMWFPARGAFRAGVALDVEWDDAATGDYSAAFGIGTRASGLGSFATGSGSRAMGDGAIALGQGTVAQGAGSLAAGFLSAACDTNAIALGERASTSSAPTTPLPCGGTAYRGAFVFSSDAPSGLWFPAAANNEFAVRASGGVRLRTSATAATGCNLAAGSGVWTCTSDRASKQGFEVLDGDDVLRKLVAMPIERWSYKSEPGVRHVGPTAQDFHAAFGLGSDDTSIGHLDLSGISLRAIQAVEARTTALQRDNEALRARLERLEALLASRR